MVNFATGQIEENNGHLSRMRHEYDIGQQQQQRSLQGIQQLHEDGATDSEDELATPKAGLKMDNKRNPPVPALASRPDVLSSTPLAKEDPPVTTDIQTALPQRTPPAPYVLNTREKDEHNESHSLNNHTPSNVPANMNTLDMQKALVKVSGDGGSGDTQQDIIQQLGLSIAQQLSKLISLSGGVPTSQPAPTPPAKNESTWDAPPLPTPPPTSEKSISAAQDVPPVSSHQPNPYSPNSQLGPRSRSLWADDSDHSHSGSSKPTTDKPRQGALRRVSFDSSARGKSRSSATKTPFQDGFRGSPHSDSHRNQLHTSQQSPSPNGQHKARRSAWTLDEDRTVMNFINHPEYNTRRVSEISRKLPGRSLQSIQWREWALRSLSPRFAKLDTRKVSAASRSRVPQKCLFLEKDAVNVVDHPVMDDAPESHKQRSKKEVADTALIYTPSTDDLEGPASHDSMENSRNAKNPNLGHQRTPWSANEVKKLVRMIHGQGLSPREAAGYLPDRGLNSVMNCWQKWKRGGYDAFLREYSETEANDTSSSTPLTETSSAVTHSAQHPQNSGGLAETTSMLSMGDGSSSDLKQSRKRKRARPSTSACGIDIGVDRCVRKSRRLALMPKPGVSSIAAAPPNEVTYQSATVPEGTAAVSVDKKAQGRIGQTCAAAGNKGQPLASATTPRPRPCTPKASAFFRKQQVRATAAESDGSDDELAL